ncbi:MAG TPA: PASTA domain-containing protein, partial [Phycisphaerales bacterium]|nr:PASTA domain-containing protein [Phycisphaerales bacterium]
MKTTLSLVERHHSDINRQANGLLRSSKGLRYAYMHPLKVQTKIFICLFTLCALLLPAASVYAGTIWNDDFESGDLSGWTTSGTAIASTDAANADTYGGELNGTAWMERAVSTASYTTIHVKYDRKTDSMDTGENLYVEWFDGSDWNNLETTQDPNWISQEYTCAANADNNTNFKIRFLTDANEVTEYAYLDTVVITGTDTFPPTPNPATLASTPTNIFGSENLAMSATIGSDALSEPVEYYFAETTGGPGANDSGWRTANSYLDSGLLPNTTYTYTVQMRDAVGNTGTVSVGYSGTTQALVPDVVGLTQAAAEANIVAAGLTVGTVTTDYSDTVALNDVISQNLTAGTSVPAGTSVNLVISLGVQMVTVPDVVGLTQVVAGTTLTAAQLSTGTVTTAYSDTVATGLVISQSPIATTSVVHDTTVDIEVSLGVQMV